MWQLDYYAEGSVPDALMGVPIRERRLSSNSSESAFTFDNDPPPLAERAGSDGPGAPTRVLRRRQARYLPESPTE